MTSGTKIRAFARLLDTSDAPLWVIGSSGNLVYLSAGVAQWLSVDIESLVGRRCIAGSAVSDDPLDRIAAALSPPVGLNARGTASLRIQPTALGDHRPETLETRFVRVGSGDAAITIAVAGAFDDRNTNPELEDAVAIRQRLDAWRRRQAAMTTIATSGVSSATRMLRRRLQIAGATRTDVAFLGPAGCNSESIAARVHQLSAAGEPMVTVDGQLMDPELLDATLMPLINQLSDSSDAQATALVRRLDEMPIEAQSRLAELHATYEGRMRLLALCGSRPEKLAESTDAADVDSLGFDNSPRQGMIASLAEILSALSVRIEPLANRVEDIPLIATALLDARRASGEGTAERISRAAMDALVIYPWPGNFDELDASIRHAIRTSTGTSIAAEHLPLAIRSYRPGHLAEPKLTAVSLDDEVARYELRLILDAVEAADGNRAKAARQLGISRGRLLRKIEEGSKRSREQEG